MVLQTFKFSFLFTSPSASDIKWTGAAISDPENTMAERTKNVR